MAGVMWPNRVRITVPADAAGTGSFDADDVWQPDAPAPAPVVVYDGPANVDDAGRVTQGRHGGKSADGTPALRSDAVCYLKKKNAAAAVPLGAQVTVTWPDKTTSDAVVIGFRRGDNSLDLQRV